MQIVCIRHTLFKQSPVHDYSSSIFHYYEQSLLITTLVHHLIFFLRSLNPGFKGMLILFHIKLSSPKSFANAPSQQPCGLLLVAQKVNNLPAMQKTWVSIPGLGRSLREGNDYPLQYSCLENSMDRGTWWATVHGVTKR